VEHGDSSLAVGRNKMALWIQDTLAVAGMLLFVVSSYVLAIAGEAWLA
jgi:hypothetical protein